MNKKSFFLSKRQGTLGKAHGIAMVQGQILEYFTTPAN
jgi:hypothetical protein